MNRFFIMLIGTSLVFGLLVIPALGNETGHEDHSNASMTMHHMHIMINHAVGMAAEGSNMVMLGQMGLAEGVDEISIQQGQKMIADAENLVTEILSGKVMVDLHKHGYGGDVSPEMAYTHEVGTVALAYIQGLKKMSMAPAQHP